MTSENLIKNYSVHNYFLKSLNLGVLLFYHVKSRPKVIPSYFFLFLGLFFSTATKLRLPGLPIGLSEVFFLLFAITAYMKNELDWRSKKYFHFVLLLFSFLLLSNFGTYYNNFQNISLELFFHDNLSFIYTIFLIWSFLVYKGSLEIALKTIIITSICISIFCFLSTFFNDSLFLYFYYFNFRFSFFSVNPNQFALLLVPFPFFIAHFYYQKQEAFWSRWSFFLILMLGCCAAVVYSVAVFFSWGIICFFITYYFLRNKKKLRHTSQFFLYGGISFISMIILLFIFEVNIIYFYIEESIANKLHTALTPIINELQIRLGVWNILIKELAKNWLIIGVGPGALVKFNDINFESHNAFLSILFYGGVLPFLSALYGLYIIGIRARENGPFLFMALISLILFSFFHHTLRMPILWFYFIYLYKEYEEKEFIKVKND